ncbi:multidrug transporter permease [Azospirillum palustre]|uniref:Multidrug transporter permease n=1 Tax=Azospirillum palustre TaxID=2044885 RepID=A0A2B8BEL8_9PROT|nr:efflux transporter outer membrane subunit [Azospirillum palustre]PGH56220.1 multidrug transporter permease [Azospirillum palustre]
MTAPSKTHRRAATLAAVCAVALVSGCSLAPLYERPAAPIPTGYPVAAQSPDTRSANQPAPGGEAASVLRSTAWCTQFPDPVLRRLVASALAHNRDLKLAAARVVEARALHGIQSASRLPTVALEGTTTHPARNNESAHQVGVTLAAYELDFFGKAQSLSDAALHEYLATEQAQRAARISVVAEVVRGYVLERAAVARVELARRAAASRTAAVGLLTRRVAAGVSSPLELEQARSLVGAADTDLIEQQLVHARAGHALALLTGYGDRTGTEDAPPFTAAAFGAGWGVARAGLPSELLTARPDILAAEQRLQAANAQIGAARAAFFPSIRLTGMGGVASGQLNSLFTPGSGALQVVPQVSLPIFDGGRNQASLDLARARESSAVIEYERAIQTAFREVSDALAGQASLERDVAARTALREVEARRRTMTMNRYLAGAVGYLEVLDVERSLFAADQALLDAKRARLENAASLYRALGGCPAVSG